MADQQYCLRWNNHQTTLVSIFDTLLQRDRFTDCTISAEGQSLAAHKILLTACSPYFEAVLSQIRNDRHPVIILKDVTFAELKALMDYMYRGEVNISQDQLAALLKVAESLQIKGLSDSGEKEKPEKRPPPLPPQPPPSVPRSSGLTIEHSRRSNQAQILDLPLDSPLNRHDGNVSPVPRKRKRPRRRSSGDDSSLGQVHPTSMTESLDSSNSREPIAASIPQNVSALLTKTAVIPEPRLHDHDLVLPDALANVDIPKIEPPTELDLLQPKEEYVDDNDDVDHITLDDDDDDMDLSQQAGPSHGGEGSSSQGYPPSWHQASDRSNDEVFMAAQEAVGGAQRDSQDWIITSVMSLLDQSVCFSCETCGSSFKQKEQLVAHILNKCSPPSYDFADSKPKAKHELSPKNEGYHCLKCGVSFQLEGAFLVHALQCKTELRCLTCSKVFRSSVQLRTHVKHECGKELRCETCNKKFNFKSLLNSHVRHECGKDMRCPKCSKQFGYIGTLNRHVLYECGQDLRCHTCDKDFKTKTQLDQHVKYKCGKDLNCITCNRDFKTRAQLREHIKYECEPELYCGKCNKAFRYQGSFIRHSNKCRSLNKEL